MRTGVHRLREVLVGGTQIRPSHRHLPGTHRTLRVVQQAGSAPQEFLEFGDPGAMLSLEKAVAVHLADQGEALSESDLKLLRSLIDRETVSEEK